MPPPARTTGTTTLSASRQDPAAPAAALSVHARVLRSPLPTRTEAPGGVGRLASGGRVWFAADEAAPRPTFAVVERRVPRMPGPVAAAEWGPSGARWQRFLLNAFLHLPVGLVPERELLARRWRAGFRDGLRLQP